MKALPLWQPWATLIAIGAKRVETRAYSPTRLGLVAGQEIAIYATKGLGNPANGGLTEEGLAALCREPEFAGALRLADLHDDDIGAVDAARLPRGSVVATCVLDRASEITAETAEKLEREKPSEFAFGDYRPGRWAWVLRDVAELDPPVLVTDQGRKQGAFEWQPPTGGDS